MNSRAITPRHIEVRQRASTQLHEEDIMADVELVRIAANKSLHQAAREGDIEILEQILASQQERVSLSSQLSSRTTASASVPFIDHQDDSGMTALHYACRNNCVDVMQKLLSRGAQPLVQGEDGITPLHLTAKYASPPTLQTFLTYLPEDTSVAEIDDEYGQTPLHYASQRSDPSCLEVLLQRNCEPNVTDKANATPLHNAAQEGRLEIVQLLVKYGANLLARDGEGETPLHHACMEGHVDVIEFLLQQAENSEGEATDIVNIADNRGLQPLHAAMYSGSKDTVLLLLQHNADPNVKTHNSRRTPLHTAARHGHLDVVQLLVSQGARTSVRDVKGQLAIHRAAGYGRTAVLEYLFQDKIAKERFLEAQTRQGHRPLALAASHGHVDTVNLLLDLGANPMMKDKVGKTPLHLAVEGDHYDVTKVLIDRCRAVSARPSVNPLAESTEDGDEEGDDDESDTLSLGGTTALLEAADKYDTRPLHIACALGHKSIARLLVDSGCQLDVVDDSDQTPLHLAVKNGRYQIVKLLLLKKVQLVADEDDKAQTPLHLAAQCGFHQIMELLIANGANLNAADDFHQTPLAEAAAAGHLKCVTVMLENDAHIDPRDKFGSTPLHVAAKAGHAKIVQLLLSRGANIAHQDKKGNTCLDVAAINKRVDVAKTILNHSHWMRVLKRRVKEEHIANGAERRLLGSTPFKQLIVHLPDVAAVALDKCVTTNEVTPDHDDYTVHYNYELLMEDPSLPGKSALWYMTVLLREPVLMHPVVSHLLRQKWLSFGRFVYYLNLFFYLIFVIFLTAFVLDNRIDEPKNFSDLNPISKVATWVVMLYCFYGIVITELLQLVQLGLEYFNWRNILDWGVYIFSLILVMYPLINVNSTNDTAHWTTAWFAGSVAIFLTWMNLLVFVRRFGGLGIYVLMFTDTLATVLRMNISVMNLLIGLAVGDIEKISQSANVNRQAIKSKYLQAAEQWLPRSLRQNLRSFETVKPNKGKGKGGLLSLAASFLDENVGFDDSKAAMTEEGVIEEVREQTDLLRETTRDAFDEIKEVQSRADASTQALKLLSKRLQQHVDNA
ncbi:hypothetical protein PTSG_08626 [Salpingoeca rosetta]|uniref:Uncharacterized protein n=1 Tax=Salpingoeca rosetta (strain ATCC 50818 / BSB-021) TaxID=946362 RepID=F2UK79_SALR5|nr:uncharacterized protein PTSG_08626 [Salpingoeca rosetta]EGD77528.1 hypothetical protein PTSG_08626 [Salpingoeca rosetta]|eukprot:XP_004990416.1 hypothetical protein PTSG_08626 [Salpingoeca rosetta]